MEYVSILKSLTTPSGGVGFILRWLVKIKAQTFVLSGDQDRDHDVSSVQVLKNGLPNSTAVIMKDCGHVPSIERPEKAAKHFLTFIVQ